MTYAAPGDHPTGLQAWAVDGIGEVTEGADLADLLPHADLRDGDVVLVTSKVLSKAEGRTRTGGRDAAIAEETVRVVARRGPTSIVENRLGLVMAAAGVDASNVAPGQVLLLPEDPDGTARRLREEVRRRGGANVAVLVTDTVGRAWRNGQTDLAIGAAGLEPLDNLSGATDLHGNLLVVTAPAVADELAGLAELVTGKLGGRPVSVVRGLGARVLPPGDHGPGAVVLQRHRSQDMFALGAREAVLAAVAGRDADCFGAPAAPEEVVAALASCGVAATVAGGSVEVDLGPGDPRDQVVAAERVRLVAHAMAWRPHSDPGAGEAAERLGLTLAPRPPSGP